MDGIGPRQPAASEASSPGQGAAQWQIMGSSSTSFSKTRSVLLAADELAACTEANSLLRRAVELARERLALERVGLYLRDRAAERPLLRGTWGTGARGETTDERSLFHELSPHHYTSLLQVRLAGSIGMYHSCVPLFASEAGRSFVIGEGWAMTTPLVAAGDLVGVMYNDSALSHAPVDEGKQAAAAVLCTLVAVLFLSNRGAIGWQPLLRKPGQSPLVKRILHTLHDEPPTTGERLARDLGVSPGHLARAFKREMAVSLVDYRNRLRMERFFEAIHKKRDACNLLEAALEAGFGSYAQFHRVYRKLHGAAPREVFSNGAARPSSRSS